MADGTLKVGTITTSSGSGTITLGQSGETVNFPSGVSITGPNTGKIVNIKYVDYGVASNLSTTSTSPVEISSNLRIDFTPISASNKIRMEVCYYGIESSTADLETRIYYDPAGTPTSFSSNRSAPRSPSGGYNAYTTTWYFNSWSGLRTCSPYFNSSNGNSVSVNNGQSFLRIVFTIMEFIQ